MSVVTQYPNWFAVTGRANFEKHLGSLSGLRCLQVGVFTGDASVWLLENVAALLVDVDTWQGSDEDSHDSFDWADVRRVYHERTKDLPGRLTSVVDTSATYFAEHSEPFDFIYIDGAHDSFSVMNDAVGAFRLLKVGGLIAFDDYNWTNVARAVDAFRELRGDRLEMVESGPQAWFRRVR